MNNYYLRISLTLSMICMLSYKTNAYKNITITPEICQITLLSHEGALSVFFEAIRQDDIETLLTFKTLSWDVRTSYQNGRILLHYASFLGKTKAIHTLISELGVDVNIKDPETGRIALHYAVLNTDPSSRLDTIYVLITLGATVNTLDNEGYTASQYVEDREKPLYFKYSEEQKTKVAELIVSSYNIQTPTLAKLTQIPSSTPYNWTLQYKKEHNIPANKQRYQKLRAQAIKMFKAGIMPKKIAIKLGVSKRTVSKWERKYKEENNIPTKQQHFQKLKAQAIKMFKAGIMPKKIAIKLGVSKRTVSKWERKYKEENNIPTKQQHFQKLKAQAIEMFKVGIMPKKIASELDTPQKIVSNWILQQKKEHKMLTNKQRYQKLRAQAIEMFKAGIIQKEIAIELGVSDTTVSRWIHQQKEEDKMPTNKQRFQKLKEEAIQMLKPGVTHKQIAIKLGTPERTVSNWISQAKEKPNILTQKQYFEWLRIKAIQMRKRDIAQRQIATTLRVAENTVSTWVSQNKKDPKIPTKKIPNYFRGVKDEAIYLVNIMGLTQRETAEVLDVPEKTVFHWVPNRTQENQKGSQKTYTLQENENEYSYSIAYINAIEEVLKGRDPEEVAKEFLIDKELLMLRARIHKYK